MPTPFSRIKSSRPDSALAISVGDPCGIGPEITVKALRAFFEQTGPTTSRAHKISKPPIVHVFGAPASFLKSEISQLRSWELAGLLVFHIIGKGSFQAGKPSKASGVLALQALQAAISFCSNHTGPGIDTRVGRVFQGERRASQSQRGRAALVTGPLDKYYVSLSHKNFEGHTEYLQKALRAKEVTMILSGKTLTVALVTTHLPLRKVASCVNKKTILRTLRHLHEFLSTKTSKPHLAVLGLNPHASDQGLFGNEEARIIEPAVRLARARGLSVEGPFPADSFFAYDAYRFDGIVAQYHDQGLIPLKMMDFSNAINVTMGLPFLRVSVDHGPAFSLARKRRAHMESLLNALQYASQWCDLNAK